MTDNTEDQKAEDLVRDLLSSYDDNIVISLKERFQTKLDEMGINETHACKIMGIEFRALKAILNGTGARIDISALIKFANFISLPDMDVIKMYVDSINISTRLTIEEIDKRKFISSQFDLPLLKKEGIINSVDDFDHIEKMLLEFLGYDSIFEYRKEVLNPLYSSTKRYKRDKMTDTWIDRARQLFKKINNPYEYDRQALIDFFPRIRWHSINVEKGLLEVVRTLYKMGITVIYQNKFSSIHVRGATFSVNKKPCIVLTDYKGYYPTLWFSLIHELHHVLFDWDKIEVNTFHLSNDEENGDMFTQVHIEDEANNFAREYLFPASKMELVSPKINDWYFVESYAIENHVHPSIIYTFYAYDNDRWGLVEKYNPPIEKSIKPLVYNGKSKNIKEIANFIKEKVLNKS